MTTPADGGVTITIDLEDHRARPDMPIRYERVMRERLLPLLDRLDARATVFVVGTVAERSPRLVADIASAGHEIGLHAWDHEALVDLDGPTLAQRLVRGVDAIGNITGRPPEGYRAASFSLVESCAAMATDAITDAGFRYSSSTVPARNPLYGYPGLPTEPFVWPSGLVEFPVPLVRIGPAELPLGGTYLRLLPRRLLTGLVDQATRSPGAWMYCHPYDFDPDERFWWEPVAGSMAPLLWVGRRSLTGKLERLFQGRTGPTMGERRATLDIDRLPQHRL